MLWCRKKYEMNVEIIIYHEAARNANIPKHPSLVAKKLSGPRKKTCRRPFFFAILNLMQFPHPLLTKRGGAA